MRKILSFTLLPLYILIISFVIVTNEKQKSDLENLGLKGKVKNVKETRFKAVKNGEKIIKGSVELISVRSFNSNGNFTEELFYKLQGKQDSKSTYKYDEKGRLAECIEYDGDNEIEMKTLYNYSVKDVVVESEYDSEDKLDTRYVHRYNEKGNISKTEVFSSDGSFNLLYKYDNKENCIEEKQVNTDGGIISKSSFLFDDKGNLIEYCNYNKNGSINSKTIYGYDSKNNRIEEKVYKPEGVFNHKSINKFDNKGSLIETTSYDSNGKIYFTSRLLYEYDNNSNWIKQTYISNNIPQTIIEREIKYY